MDNVYYGPFSLIFTWGSIKLAVSRCDPLLASVLRNPSLWQIDLRSSVHSYVGISPWSLKADGAIPDSPASLNLSRITMSLIASTIRNLQEPFTQWGIQLLDDSLDYTPLYTVRTVCYQTKSLRVSIQQTPLQMINHHARDFLYGICVFCNSRRTNQ